MRGQFHLLHNIRPQALPEEDGRPVMQIRIATDGPRRVVIAMAVGAKDGGEHPLMITAHHQLAEAVAMIVLATKSPISPAR